MSGLTAVEAQLLVKPAQLLPTCMGSSGAGGVLGVQVGRGRPSLGELWGVGRGRGSWLEVELADLRLEDDLSLSLSEPVI